ncbi:MAG: alpha/beta fold hydrolase [Cytophagales bacterium]|nr:alpha/beta fold hydrolase [Cytophagales bacterium]
MLLNYKVSGIGQPLIILHGLFGSGDNWQSIAKNLSEHYTVYLVDARNHGRSPQSDLFNYSSMANDLSAFISEQEIVNPIIVGHSMGGKTAMKYAVRTKNPIKGLVIVDIAPRYYKPHHQQYIAGLMAINLDTLTSRSEAEQIMENHVTEISERQFLLKNLYRTDEGKFAWRFNLDVIASQIDNIGEELSDSYTTEIPTLFIKGENSNYIQDKDTEQIKHIFTHSEIVSIPGAGHWVHAEKPTEFLSALEGFIQKLP